MTIVSEFNKLIAHEKLISWFQRYGVEAFHSD